MNYVVLMGKLSKDIEVIEDKEDNKIVKGTIAVKRYYKNEDGIYDVDLVDFKADKFMANTLIENCKKDDIIAIKGKLEKDGDNLTVIAEKITLFQKINKESEEEK